MRILFILDSPYAFNNGCWYYRNHLPAKALREKGHQVQFLALNSGRAIPENMMKDIDVAVFSRTYPIDPLVTLRKFKAEGVKTVYEVDDDLWNVNPDNPSAGISEEKRRQYEHLMDECDVVTTTTSILADILRRFNKNVHICPNAVFPEDFEVKELNPSGRLRVGYSGAASHWADLSIISRVIEKLQVKYDFDFILQGMCGNPLEAEIWGYERVLEYGLQPEKKKFLEAAVKWYKEMKNVRFFHIPFYPPIMFPHLLSTLQIDIGITPLNDNKFNHSKSCIKFYEYVSAGGAVLSSDVLPYNKEVGYCCKNTEDDWYNKLEKLIADEKFRKDLFNKQSTWVKENRNLHKMVTLWEDALDTPKIK